MYDKKEIFILALLVKYTIQSRRQNFEVVVLLEFAKIHIFYDSAQKVQEPIGTFLENGGAMTPCQLGPSHRDNQCGSTFRTSHLFQLFLSCIL